MLNKSQTKLKNELIKRKYLDWMKQAKGFSDKSIDSIEKALWKYEESVNQEDYALFSDKKSKDFKYYLQTNKIKSNQVLSLTSQYHHLRHVKNFFTWLSGQPGYKSRVSIHDTMYLQLTQKERRQATSSKAPKYPSKEQIKALCGFPVVNEIDKRDQALIAFTALTGMRDQAIITLSIRCFEPENLQVHQSPKLGVQTKFSKTIETTIFKVDDQLLKFILDWYKYLIKEKKYSLDDPLFPSTQIGHISETHHAYESKGISKNFWSNTGPMRKIFQKRSEQTDVPYFTPHKFRHFLINEAQRHISSVEQLKALSQNLGHENISTTFYGYGAIDTYRVGDLIKAIDFSGMTANKAQENLVKTVTEQVLKNMPKNGL
jgi:integrase